MIGAEGITPTASANIARGNSSGIAVANIESILTAGGTATVVTEMPPPDYLHSSNPFVAP